MRAEMDPSKGQVLDDSVEIVSLAAPGEGPPWESDTLPQPPAFTPRNFLRMVGPGAILLAAAIGGGEWLMGLNSRSSVWHFDLRGRHNRHHSANLF